MTRKSTTPDGEVTGVAPPAYVGGSGADRHDTPHPNGEAPNLDLLVAFQGRVEGLQKAP
jgi:hypothetical protein